MAWREANGVDFIFGLARNVRLRRAIGAELAQARWTTRKSWHYLERYN